MRKLEGVIPVLLTPLDASGKVDKASLSLLVKHLIQKNIGGLWVLGTGSEDMNLTFEQRLQVAETVCGANNGKVPLILGAGFFAMADSLAFIKATEHLDFDAYHLMPYHPLLSLDRIEWLYKTVADAAPRPLWMYTSANWCRYIPPEFIEKIKGYPNIAGIKFSTSNAVHSEKAISLADDNFQVITAVVRTFYANLCMGVAATTTVEACPFADAIIDIYEKFKNGALQSSFNAQKKLNRFLEKMPPEPGRDNFLKVAEGKYILSRSGLCQAYMSGYYRGLTDQEKDRIDALIEDHPWLNAGK